MKKLLTIVMSILMCSCTHMNFYEGRDAARIPLPCQFATVTDANGKRYFPYVSIIEIDGAFTGSGNGCPTRQYTYQIKPGEKRIKLISNFVSESEPSIFYGDVLVQARLVPNGTYSLSTTYNGTVIEVRITDLSTGQTVAQGETAIIKRSGTQNAALMAVPLLIK